MTQRWSKADSNSASHPRATPPAATRFVADSAPEESGFELAVPSDGAVPKHERYLPVATLSGFGAGGHRNLPKAGKGGQAGVSAEAGSSRSA